MTTRNVTRLPRIRRFEYLVEYLEAIGLDLDEKAIGLKLSEKKRYFETRKLQALARGKTFSKQLTVAKNLASECRKLALDLRYAAIENDDVKITRSGIEFLRKDFDTKKQEFCRNYIGTFGLAENFLRLFVTDEKVEYTLPMKKDNEKFREVATKQGITIDQTNFEILRDMFHFFGLINWFPFISETVRFHKVYSTSCLCDSNEVTSRNTGRVQLCGKTYCPRSANRNDLRKAIWEEYLVLANYVPKRAVLYSGLRDRTCYRLHVPDEEFDMHVRAMLDEDPELMLVGSKGSIPFSPSLFTFLKSVPPEIGAKIIVYLKMDRKKK